MAPIGNAPKPSSSARVTLEKGKRNEHLIVIMLEHQAPGVEFEVWQLHITIVPWFRVGDGTTLDKLLQKIAQKHTKFSVKIGRTQLWGKKEKYEVVIIDDPGQLHRLHWDIFHGLEQNGFPVHQKDFLGEKYKPHFIVRNEIQKAQIRPTEGQELSISSFWLVSQERLKKSGRMIKKLKKEYQLA